MGNWCDTCLDEAEDVVSEILMNAPQYDAESVVVKTKDLKSILGSLNCEG